MVIDESVISYAIAFDTGLVEFQRAGVSPLDFEHEFKSIWHYLVRAKQEQGSVPSRTVVKTRFPDLYLPRMREQDFPHLLAQLRQRKKHKDFAAALTKAAGSATSYEEVDGAIQGLQSDLNELSTRNGKSHLVDLFDSRTSRRMVREMRTKALSTFDQNIMTGLRAFDQQCGGLAPQQMAVIIGRPSLGKSWLDLLFVANAVMYGKTVMLYPLEMTLYDTACRLYTLFSQAMFGPSQVLRNRELKAGQVNMRKVRDFLATLEDQLPGRIIIADMGELSDPYTAERIEAEVEVYKPDMFWVDYLTLMKPPPSSGVSGDWQSVRMLSNAIKGIAMRHNVVGGCSAQVNREALRVKTFLPRLEHVAYGDSIGQDADVVFSINRKSKNDLYYSVVKNRHGPEIGGDKGIHVMFDVDRGLIFETNEDEETSEAD